MWKLLTIILVISIVSQAAIPEEQQLKSLWTAWKIKHNKVYAPLEEQARYSIFAHNNQKISEFNLRNDDVKLALNKFADLTSEEFRLIYLHSSTSDLPIDTPIAQSSLINLEIPDSVDWREKGAVTPVVNSGSCAASWARSAAGALEGLNFIQTGELVALSVGQLVDCVTSASGCGDGLPTQGFAYTASKGIESAEDYLESEEGQGTCHYDSTKAIKVNSGFEWVLSQGTNDLMSALTVQPVSVEIEADQSIFQFYSSGVIAQGCGSNTDLSVLAVGYEATNGGHAFIVKNSWGADWGANGYVYISTDTKANGGDGVCGILSRASIPKP